MYGTNKKIHFHFEQCVFAEFVTGSWRQSFIHHLIKGILTAVSDCRQNNWKGFEWMR